LIFLFFAPFLKNERKKYISVPICVYHLYTFSPQLFFRVIGGIIQIQPDITPNHPNFFSYSISLRFSNFFTSKFSKIPQNSLNNYTLTHLPHSSKPSSPTHTPPVNFNSVYILAPIRFLHAFLPKNCQPFFLSSFSRY